MLRFDLDLPPTLANWLVVGVMALTFFIVAKVIFAKFHVPGLSDLVLGA